MSTKKLTDAERRDLELITEVLRGRGGAVADSYPGEEPLWGNVVMPVTKMDTFDPSKTSVHTIRSPHNPARAAARTTATKSTQALTERRAQAPGPDDWHQHAEDAARAIEGAYHKGWCDALRQAYDMGPGWVIEQVMSLSPDLPVPDPGAWPEK